MKKFTEYSSFNLSELNKDMLERWREAGLFAKSVALREGAPSFVFYEGPPSANGMPGIHHVMARTIKDLFCRYKTMKGFHVKRKAGWDTHGLPVELGVERSLGITKEDIGKKISVDEYNAACRREVMKYTREWETLTDTMGYWVDMADPYITYDNRYIESVWWLLSQLYGKNLLYKGYTIQPYSPAAGTGLSSHELNQPGCYRDVKDTTCTAQFELVDPIEPMQGWGKACMLAWTTTPWTLPSNTALAVGPSIRYVVARTFNPYSGEKITVTVAEDLADAVLGAKGRDASLEEYNAGDKIVPWQVVATLEGHELVGMHYRQLLPWVNPGEGAFRVIPGDYVTTEDGTGIVHIAGTFGADDLRVSKAAGVPPLHLIDRDGKLRPMVDLTGRFYRIEDLDPAFVAEMVDVDAYSRWAGKYVKNDYNADAKPGDETLDIEICMELKMTGKVFRIEKHVHNYPHCWRTDKPVLYYPLDSWFVRSTAMRDELIENNSLIKWKPASTGSGRFGKWLENLQDWNLSRSRFWGTPLPIWRTENGAEEMCIDSVATLYAEIEKAVAAGIMASNPFADKGFVPGDYSAENYEKIDLHRPYVDDIVLVSPTGKPMYRETDLIDVWFDSGSMPYAQIHYPFENKDAFDNGELFPADFIAEGVDQTRGWFFTLHAIGTMVFGSPAFKAVVSNGLVLDKNGEKMSKRKGNAVDPFETIEKFGSDPLRWYMIWSSSPWDNLKYDHDGVAEVSRKFFSTLSNTYNFFAMYANVDGFTGDEAQIPLAERPEIDRWILSLLNTLVKTVTEEFDDYEPTRATRDVHEFVLDKLSNWYVRLNRKRFWSRGLERDKLAAYQTLYTCLLTVSKLMAPVAPFFSDRLFRDLTAGAETVESVHLADFPMCDDSAVDAALEQRMDIAQRLTSLVLSLRKKANIKVRQPLAKILVPASDSVTAEVVDAIAGIVKAEVNVKDLKLVASDNEVFVKRVDPDFKRLGPKMGKLMKQAAAAIKALDASSISDLEKNGVISIGLDGTSVDIELADVKVISEDIPGWLVANEGDLTVALDIDVTPELMREGLAREIINRVQNIGYDITDHINLLFVPSPEIEDVLAGFGGYIGAQVLADSITTGEPSDPNSVEILDLDEIKFGVVVTPA